jgi:hypothetical protein
VISEVCTPLSTRCLRASFAVLEEAYSLARPQNCVCGVIAAGVLEGMRLVVSWLKAYRKMMGSSLGEAISETHLHVGKVRGLSTELPDYKLSPCKGL